MTSDEKFETRVRELLAAELPRVDSRTRSRLAHARHAAVSAASRGRSPLASLRSRAFVPAAGAVAAAVALAIILWTVRPTHFGIGADSSVAAFEDVSLLSDNDGLDMVDADASFYEWVAGQT